MSTPTKDSLIDKVSYVDLFFEGDVQQSIDFYTALGFQLITKPDDGSSWLALETRSNICNLSESGISEDVLFKLTESSNSPKFSIKFGSKNLKSLTEYISTNSLLSTKLDKSDETDNNLALIDPSGNKLVFSSNLHPFSTAKHTLAPKPKPAQVPVSDFFAKTGEGKKIAVLTSGGDSQGMNCAVRAIVRAAIARGCQAYVIMEGYQGLVDGGKKIVKMSWGDVRKYVSVSGTIIGTARCKEFREREGRLNGALNLINNGIDALAVIGGDGSLTGADVFRSEWPDLVQQLLKDDRIDEEQAKKYAHLNIVGLVGSIDNDMSGTDFTIGAISSLTRICESVDNITSTALSHQRAFVIEVMGRHCGWLALMSAICTGADFVFIPEKPMDEAEWKYKMCSAIKKHRDLGRRSTIVIVSEGAIDRNLQPIKSESVANVITEALGIDTRVTYLGHVQRGGIPAAQDRILGTVQGIQAVDVILESTPTTPSKMIAIENNRIQPVPLMEAVQKTKDLARLVSEKKFQEAMQLRDPAFIALWDAYKHSEYTDLPETTNEFKPLRIGIIHIGAPAGGMNAATRTAARLAINLGHVAVAIHNGIRGLISGEFSELSWIQVGNWMARGGSELGTNREMPEKDLGMVAFQLQRHKIDGLLIIGGFEAYKALTQLAKSRSQYPAFCIPLAHIPATISNNVPGTDYSLGSDTSLNAITEACDRITQSAAASHSRVFVVEVQGGKSGYLATLAGLAVGASKVYIPEEGISLTELEQDVALLKSKFQGDRHRSDSDNVGRLILKTDAASSTYKTELIADIFAEEGAPGFDARSAVLGHIQQGGITSPVDRLHAALFAHRAFFWLLFQCQKATQPSSKEGCPTIYTTSEDSAVVVGNVDGLMAFSTIPQLAQNTDWKNRRPLDYWWKYYPEYNRMLARHVPHEELY